MLLERTPPKRRTPAVGASASPGKLATPTRQSNQPSTPGSVTRSQTRQQQQQRAEPATEWPSLESMAEPVRERRAQNNLVRGSASKPPPGSASRHGITGSASKPFSSRPKADVPSSLPRPPATRPGTLHPYPAGAALQRQVGNSSSSLAPSGRSSLTGLDGARARAGDETPKAVSDAKRQQQQNQLVGRPPIGTALEKHTAGDTTREEAAGELKAGEAPTENPASAPASSDAQDDFALRMEALLADPRAAFQDRRRQDMRKSIPAAAETAQEDAPATDEGPSADVPKSSYALQVEAALAQGPEFNPFGTTKRSALHDERPLPAPREPEPAPVTAASFRSSLTRRTDALNSSVSKVQTPSMSHAALPNESESTPRAAPAPARERTLTAEQTFSPRARPMASPLKESLLSPSKLSSPHRLDPLTRNERVQALEIESLRKKAAELNKELAQANKRIQKVQDDAEGWKAECEGLESERETLLTQTAALERRFLAERNKRENWELKCMELRCESDRRQWEAMTGSTGKEALRDANTELVICRNEVTYQTYRGHELQHALDMAVEQATALKRKMRLRLEDANAKLEAALEECETLRAAVDREKERRKDVAREAMKVEAHRDELLDQIEQLEQSAGARAAKVVDPAELRAAKAKADSLEKELRRAERKAEAEEQRRMSLEAELEDLKTQLASKAKSSSSTGAASRKRKVTPDLDDFEDDAPAEVSPPRPAAPAPARRGRPPKQRPVEPEPQREPEPEPAPAPVRSRPVPTATASKAKTSKAKAKPVYRDDFEDDEGAEEDEDEAADVYRAAPSSKRAKTQASAASTSAASAKTKAAPAAAPAKAAKVAPAPISLDITATPIVRKPSKVILGGAASKANVGGASAAEAGGEKKKKRKLLGGAGAKGPGFFHFGAGSEEGGSLNPTLNIPTELSPVKAPNPHAMRPAGAMFGR